MRDASVESRYAAFKIDRPERPESRGVDPGVDLMARLDHVEGLANRALDCTGDLRRRTELLPSSTVG